MKRRFCKLAVVALFLGSCRNDFSLEASFGDWILRRPIGLSIVPTGEIGSKQVLWASENESLVVETKQEQKLVMVSLFAGTSLEQSLRSDPRTVLYRPADFDKTGRYLLSLANTTELDQLASDVHKNIHLCGGLEFIDSEAALQMSKDHTLYAPLVAERFAAPSVESLISAAKAANIASGIDELEALGTRMHSTTTGKSAADKVEAMFTAVRGTYESEAEQVEQPVSEQKSMVVRIPGQEAADEVVIIGAHLDSITKEASDYDNAPGADDDASGVATLVEIFRVLAKSNARFARTVEFHAYAAEEVGLVGSKTIANSYAGQGVKVVGMLQIDMNAYHSDPKAETIYFVNTDTSKTLTRGLKALMTTYLGGNYQEKSLSAGTSDHKSWTSAGFRAAFPFEDPEAYNPFIHSPDDTRDNATNTALSLRFAKLGLAYLAHYAGLSTAVNEAEEFDVSDDLATLGDDLKIAITSGDNLSFQYWGVSAPQAVGRVELCRIDDKDALGCAEELNVLEKIDDDKGRSRHGSTKSFAVAIGGKFRLMGYSDKDVLLYARQVKVEKK